MTSPGTTLTGAEGGGARWARAVVAEAAGLRLPDLDVVPPDEVLYRVRDRHGVDVVATTTTALTEVQLTGLLRYRLAQYLTTGFFDPAVVYQRRLTGEPRSEVSDDDVHVVATASATGEILCYAVLRRPAGVPAGATLRTPHRPLLPLERAHGRGILNRLRLLPDLPMASVREVGRFVKNQQRPSADGLQIRAPIETVLGVLGALIGRLRPSVQAVVGSFQEEGAKRNLDYFHVPVVVVHGTVPCTEEHSLLAPRYRNCATYPFAFLVADLERCAERLAAVEEALGRSGRDAVLRLLALKHEAPPPTGSGRSSFEPSDGLPALAAADVAQQDLSARARRRLHDVGSRLRSAAPFAGLSEGEAAVLASLTVCFEAGPGDVLVRQSDVGDDLFVVADGHAEVRLRDHWGDVHRLARLGSGDHFGEISLITGGTRSADVVALTPMSVLKITGDLYRRYLAQMLEVDLAVTRAAATRLRSTTAAGPSLGGVDGGRPVSMST